MSTCMQKCTIFGLSSIFNEHMYAEMYDFRNNRFGASAKNDQFQSDNQRLFDCNSMN